MKFVHLHCHTHYSLLDGANRIPELVAHVKAQGMDAVAITDHGNLYGAIEFYRACKDAGVNPIIGYEAYVAPGKRSEREARRRGDAGFHLTLLAKNRTGFKNLIKMASAAFLDGYHYVPRIDKELLAAHADGLICLSGCASSEFSESILKDRLDEATNLAQWFHNLFGDDFYVEIQNNGLEIQKLCCDGAVDIANRLGLPLVATCDAHYLTQADSGAHDVLLCINTGRTLNDPNRLRYGSDQFYVRAPEEMYQLFPGHAEAVKRSQEIADGVHIDLDFKARHFPVFTPPKKKSPEQYLRELCAEGLIDRYGPGAPPEAQARREAAETRLEHELNIICRMGFASYFLIVWDFVRFAREQGIPATARGSGCGAVVSYVLKLSHVCPLEYDLLFERFLDPNRAEAPDIDIDFCQDRRERVIQYVKQKYGEGSVAQIATFGTLAAKAALKDVGRALDIPLDRVNLLTKQVPARLHATLDDALAESPEFRREYESDPTVREWVDIARKLEGTNRNAGTHAAGVVIANGPITDYVPVQRPPRKGDDSGARANGEQTITTQWQMGDLDKVGMLKMDFLGLRNLTVLDNAVKLIKKTRGDDIDPQALPLDDPKTYQLLQRGDAKGVFQLESDGIRELLKRMKPDNIRDLIAVLALYRPGPLQGGMVDSYVNRKHGREQWTYPHPVLKEILDETYGVMVYQEQIMRILNRLGGIELSDAYACIKAISKKKQDIIDARKADFVKGALERGVSAETAEEIFGLIVFFGGYGFNKCVVENTIVTDARTGERRTVGDLFRRRRSFHVHSLGDDGRLRARPVADVVWNGRKPVFALRTAQGKEIRATANHPFRVLDGWKNLGELRPGDRIAAPRHLPVPAEASWPRHEIITYAGLLSEGNTCHPTSLYFYGNDPALVQDFADAAAQFPDTVARVYTRPNGRMEVCVNTGRDCRFRAARRPDAGADDGGLAVLAVEAPPARSGAFRWAERLGILGRKAPDKVVHPSAFGLCDADLELFLGRLWAGDGYVGVGRQVPYYATSSRQLAKDLQLLLLRLGVVSGVHHKTFRYRGGLRDGYTVHLVGEEAIRTFIRRVGPHVLGKEREVAALVELYAARAEGRSCKDTVPAAVRAWVDAERRARGLTWGELEQASGLSMVEFQKKSSAKRGFRRETLARLADFFGSDRLSQAAHSDVYWDTVVSIEPAGEEDTYDLTVEEDHNFVADGLIVHNSHTAAYAQIGYQTAYLKAHYTAEYMAALLTSEIDDGNKRDVLVDHISDARRLGVEVLPPDINAGEPDFTVRDGKIVFGLTAIKGVGRGAAEEVARARAEKGPFRDLFDFCERVDLKVVNRTAVERLIKAGAFDAFGRRAALALALPRAIQAAGELQQDRRRGQMNFFDVLESDGAGASERPAESLPDVPEWPDNEKLKFEKEALDFYFSSHPLAQHEAELRRFASHAVEHLPKLEANQEVLLGGMLAQVRLMNTKRPGRNGHSRYARCTLEDFTGQAECVMWPDEYVHYKDEIADDRIVLVKGVVEHNGERVILVLTRVMSLETARKELTRGLLVTLSLAEHSAQVVEQLGRELRRYPGSCPVYVQVRDAAGRRAVLRAGETFRVNPAALDLGRLEMLLGPGRVAFSGK